MAERPGGIIRASEVGQYVYCARAWWLGQVQGYSSEKGEEMRLGQEAHRAHGRMVVGYQRLERVAYILLFLALLIGLGLLWAGGR
ncbi:MAG: hypothetical protein ACE5MB_11575 [Anaerolineae bacterium]